MLININQIFKQKTFLLLIILPALLLAFYYLRTPVLLLAISLPVGFLSTFIVIKDNLTFIERLGLGLIFAAVLQTFNIVILWATFDYLHLGLLWSLVLLTTVELIFLIILLRSYEFTFRIDRKLDLTLFAIFILGLMLRLWFQSFNVNHLTPDGAYYSDIARNLVEKGNFSSNRLDIDPGRTYQDQNGFFGNTYVSFVFCLFFEINGVSFDSSKLAVVITGSLIIISVYFLGRELFNEKVGVIAAFLTSIYPTLLFYSSIPFGAEVISNLFFFTFVFLFVRIFKSSEISPEQIAFTCLVLFLSRGSWKYCVDFFLVALPLLLFIITKKLKVFLFSLLLALTLLVCLYSSILPTWWIPLMISLLVMTIVGLRSNDVDIKKLSWIFLFFALFINLGVLRNYMHSEIFSYATSSSGRISSAISVASSTNVLERSRAWFDGVNNLNYYLVILSLAGLTFKGKTRNVVFITMFTLVYSILFILFNPLIEFEERFFIPIFLSLIISCSYSLERLYYTIKERTKWPTAIIRVRLLNNYILKLKLNTLLTLFISLLILLAFLYPHIPNGYSTYLKKMGSIDPVDYLYIEPTIHWIKTNTSTADIFLNPNPTYYAWFAKRKVGIIRNVNISHVYEIITELDVDYIIIDPAASYYLPEIMMFIKTNWEQPLPGFNAVFYKQYSSSIPEVIVYSTKDARDLSLVFEYLLITSCEDAQGFTVGTTYYTSTKWSTC